ncbi:MAG: hypothetical protein V1857_00765 [archaeon]
MSGSGEQHHEVLAGLLEQLKEVFEGSEQGIYLYLDDHHKACNKRFASLLDYGSPEEWAADKRPFADVFVDERSQDALVSAYQDAMEKLVGSSISVTWRGKEGREVATRMILVPVSYRGHVFALHFVSETE